VASEGSTRDARRCVENATPVSHRLLDNPGLRFKSAENLAFGVTSAARIKMNPIYKRWSVALVLAIAPALSQALVFAVNEGVTYRVPDDEIRAKYAAIAADLAKILHQPVTIEPVAAYPRLRQGLTDKAYDLALVHPAHLSIVAMKNSGYRLVAVTKGFLDYRANFLVKAGSPLKTLADLSGSRIGAPDEDSITAWLIRASIRDALGDAKRVNYVYTRYQDAVPFFVENNLTLCGATAAGAVIKDWKAKGGRVLAQSKPVPIKHIIASPLMSNADVDAVRDYLLALDTTEEGRKKLVSTKWQGFVAYDQAELMALGVWLGL
jgi:phosphonate transport system substrate-binding protein